MPRSLLPGGAGLPLLRGPAPLLRGVCLRPAFLSWRRPGAGKLADCTARTAWASDEMEIDEPARESGKEWKDSPRSSPFPPTV